MNRTERIARATEITERSRPAARIASLRGQLAALLSSVRETVEPSIDLDEAERRAGRYIPRVKNEILSTTRAIRRAEQDAAEPRDEEREWLRNYRYVYRKEMERREEQAEAERLAVIEAKRAAMAAEGGPATSAQISYLRRLGYRGSVEISKGAASRLIDTYKTLTASDVDDFTGPDHTW